MRGLKSTVTSKTRFTPDELLRLPDAVSYELVDGQLVERNVSKASSRVGARIVHLLMSAVDMSGDAEVYGSDLGYRCFPEERDRVRKADASLVRKERLQSIDKDPGFMPIPADLVVEVISPNDRWYDVSRKVEEYLAAWFGQVWVIDPGTGVVTVHHSDGTVTKLRENDEISGAPALAEFRCRVSEFFQS